MNYGVHRTATIMHGLNSCKLNCRAWLTFYRFQVPGSAFVVPDVTNPQKTAICRILRRVLRTTDMKAWQRQAYSRLISIVRSSPNKLHTVFDRAAKKPVLSTGRPECCYHKQRALLETVGRLCEAEGHLAVVPVQITTRDGQVLRPRDRLLVNGLKARDVACRLRLR